MPARADPVRPPFGPTFGRFLRRLLRACACLALLAAVLIAALVLLLRGSPGDRLLTEHAPRLLAPILAESGLKLHCGAIRGPLPERLRVSGLRLEDKDGPWLELPEGELALRPWELLSGVVHVEAVKLERPHLARLPEPVAAPETPSKAHDAPLPLPLPLPAGLRLHVANVHVEEAHIEPRVAGLPDTAPQGAAEALVCDLDAQLDADERAAAFKLDGTIRLRQGKSETSPVLRAHADGAWDGETLHADVNLRLQAEAAELLAVNGRTVAASNNVRAENIHANVPDADALLAALIPLLPPAHGKKLEELRADVPRGGLTLRADAEMENGGGRASLALQLDGLALSLAGRGAWKPTGQTVHIGAEVEAELADVGLLLGKAGEQPVNGQVAVKANLEGRPDALQARLAARSPRLAFHAGPTSGADNVNLEATVSLAGQDKDASEPGSARTEGASGGAASRLDKDASEPGSARTEGASGGTASRLDIEANLRLEASAVHGAPLRAEVNAAGRLPDIGADMGAGMGAGMRVQALVDLLGLRLDGDMRIRRGARGPLADGTASLAVTDWAMLGALAGLPARAGEARLKLAAQTNRERQDLEANLHISGLRLPELPDMGDVGLDSLEARIQAKDVFGGPFPPALSELSELSELPMLPMLDVVADLGSGRVSGLGSGLAWTKGRITAATGQDGRIAFAATVSGPFSAAMRGDRLAASAALRGLGRNARGDLKLDVTGLSLPGLAASGAALRVRGEVGRDLNLRATLEGLGDQPAALSLRLPLRLAPRTGSRSLPLPLPDMDAPLSGRLDWKGELAPLWKLAPLPGRSLSGAGLIRAVVRGSLNRPELEADASVSGGRFEDLTLGLLLADIDLEARYGRGRPVAIRLRATDGRTGGQDGRKGRGELTASGSLDLGPVLDPVPGPAPGPVPGPVPGNAPRLDVRGAFADFQPLRRDDLSLNLSGDFSVTGAPASPSVTADVVINQGAYTILGGLGASVRTLDVTDKAASPLPEPAAAPARPPAGSLDVRLRAPHRLFIRGRGLFSEWKADLRLQGALNAPALVGDVRPVRGTFDLLQHQFTFAGGAVAFTGGLPPNPVLDLPLEYIGPNVRATLAARGTARAPRFELSSDPPLPRDEIIARVMFGKSFSQLSRMESIQAANEAAALAGAGDTGGLRAIDAVRDALGLDTLRFGSMVTGEGRRTAGRDASMRSTAGTSTSATTVEAGKYVLDNVYLGVEQGATENTTGVRVEVDLLPNVSVDARTSSMSNSVGLNWKKDY